MLTTTMIRIIGILDGARDLSSTTLAMVSGVPATTLQDALRDRRYLGNEKESHVLVTAKRCADVMDAIKPMSIPKGDWQSLKRLVETNWSPEEIQAAVSALFEDKHGE